MFKLNKIKYFKILISSTFIFAIINSNSYSSELTTGIVPYGAYKNLYNFEIKENNSFNAEYKKAEYFKWWDILDDSLVINNISKDNRIIVDDFMNYCNTLCNRISFQYVMQDLPQYCSDYYDIAGKKLSIPCINGLKSQYTILSDIDINIEQLLNYYSNLMYSICVKSIHEILNAKNNQDCLINTISSYIDVIKENISWIQDYILPNLNIKDGQYNIKYKIQNNLKESLAFPINRLNKLKNNINKML